ncbi:leucine-rich repeat protein [Treponema sp. OMZ 857]|uniref:leucine-rich repeat protein n=1 Tax=Treponema sp. OMZ 857 TaxID=1643513 RepID=UPI0020A32AB5|nr:leucine-rich repeat protein [Treponema sp. OMZ 857]UTC43789.1 leucine-rich repeat domain-containing protein [Treponema sp. OMZ 857]
MNMHIHKMGKRLNWFAGVLMFAIVFTLTGCKPINGHDTKKPGVPSTPETFSLTFSAGEYGTLKVKSDGIAESSTSPINIEFGKTVEFTAVPSSGYQVDLWTVTPLGALMSDGRQGDTTAKVKITANTMVGITFKPVYTQVLYTDLDNCLKTIEPAVDGICYIEVTGLTKNDVKHDWDGASSQANASPLGEMLKKYSQKRIALKFGDTPISGLTDMDCCFYGCANLVEVSDIPSGISNMQGCFIDCTSLETAPIIPASVINIKECFAGCTSLSRVPVIPQNVQRMGECFSGCISLVSVPVIPATVEKMKECFNNCTKLTAVTLQCNYNDKFENVFQNCTGLTAGSIKVPTDQLQMYKDHAHELGAQAEWFTKDE